MNFTARTDRQLVRTTGGSIRYALLEFAAPRLERTSDRPPVNLAFVLDRSGSMGGSKIELARLAIRDALARLDDRDRFALVAYDDVVEVVTESTPATRRPRPARWSVWPASMLAARRTCPMGGCAAASRSPSGSPPTRSVAACY